MHGATVKGDISKWRMPSDNAIQLVHPKASRKKKKVGLIEITACTCKIKCENNFLKKLIQIAQILSHFCIKSHKSYIINPTFLYYQHM